MPNTISKETLDALEKRVQREIEVEQKMLDSMSESEVIAYMAVKSSFQSKQ